jgi:glycosyltransferase involved in cell wall biosynthesis
MNTTNITANNNRLQQINKSLNSNSKKILVIGHTDGNGGSQTAFKKFVDFNIKEGNNFKFLAISNDPDGEWIRQHKNYSLGTISYTTPSISVKLLKVYQLVQSGFKIKSYAPDIMVTVGLNNSSNFLTKFMKRNSFKIAQDFTADRQYDDLMWAKSYQLFDGIALQSVSMLDYWLKDSTYDSSKLNWMPCFPEPPANGILKRINPLSTEKELRMGYFGRLADNKGLDLLISSLSEMEDIANIKLDIWGTGDEKSSLEKLITDLNMEQVVSLKGGFPFGDDAAKLMISYDLLVLCSTRTEGLPLILLEAMAYGLPLLVTDIGAIRDCTINNPDTILVLPNEESIIQGIREAFAKVKSKSFDPKRQAKYYENNFSHKVMSDRWRACLKNPGEFYGKKVK